MYVCTRIYAYKLKTLDKNKDINWIFETEWSYNIIKLGLYLDYNDSVKVSKTT